MERLAIAPRPDFQSRLEAQGLSFHSWDDYWNEAACYRFSLRQVEEIEAATEELHRLCMEALRTVVAGRRLGELGVPEAFWPAIAESLAQEEFSLYGRLDLAYDGASPPKLLEYNADTPTSLLESAVCQWYWLEDCYPERDQFNSLHERLVDRWRALPGEGPVYFASIAGNEEDWVCITYLLDTLVQAGREGRHIDVEQIGWNPRFNAFVDQQGIPIGQLFKLYPWEWLMREDFGKFIRDGRTRFIEPMWKSVLSCKGLLPILWELFPDHPNLLEARFRPDGMQSYAKKPLYSREGANIQLVADGRPLAEDDGPYGAEGYIYQRLVRLPNFDGRYPVIGSWLVNGEAAGMCVREDSSPITTNMSRFVPHYFVD
ncbi:MAG TPA: glutathionylspermidine synthase family protein [Rhodocyclaceae bacterium]|nr:glutathionylspermidine synthase family protein [Rhodocyclaceae bacterium]